jgi:hypothetical protein
MRESTVPIILGTVGGAVGSAAIYRFFWQHAFPGAQAPIETFGLGLTAFTGAVFGGIGASVAPPSLAFRREIEKNWRLWLMLAALLAVEVLIYWKMGGTIHRWNRYDFILGSFLFGYLVRRVYAALVGKRPLKKPPGTDEVG